MFNERRQASAGEDRKKTLIKRYIISQPSIWCPGHKVIQCEGTPFLWVNCKMYKHIHLQTGSRTGPVVAAVKAEHFRRNFRYILGNPDCTEKGVWSTAHNTSFCGEKKYRFQVPTTGAWYEWRRTHNNELGAKRFGKNSFKLIDANGDVEKVLAAFIYRQSIFGHMHEFGSLDCFEKMEEELEIVSLLVLLGIQNAIRRKSGG